VTVGPAWGWETGIKGLLGGEHSAKGQSQEVKWWMSPRDIVNSPYQPEKGGRERYWEAMASATGRRLGLGVRIQDYNWKHSMDKHSNLILNRTGDKI
jgi:hypothetical protein